MSAGAELAPELGVIAWGSVTEEVAAAAPEVDDVEDAIKIELGTREPERVTVAVAVML